MNDFFVSLMLLGSLSGNNLTMPYWATANQFGVMPDGTGAMGLLQAGNDFDRSKTVQWKWGASLGARYDVASDKAIFLPDEAYAAVKWKFLCLEGGMAHVTQKYLAPSSNLGTISTTAGNVISSGNAQPTPGYTLKVLPVVIPGTGEHLQLYATFGDYWTFDQRYVQGAMIHNTAGGMIIGLTPDNKLHLTLGIDHYAMWGGTHPVYGKMSTSFANYCRMLVGAKAKGGGYSQGDEENVIGNHLGHEIIALDYKGDGWTARLQHDHPYEDKSGMFFRNFPDGVTTLSFGWDNKDKWVTDIIYEFQYTMWQSGTCERRPATQAEIDSKNPALYWNEYSQSWELITGGADNYFNNYEYCSGWTHYGRTIGNPSFYVDGTMQQTWKYGELCMGVENNRLILHHLGIAGKLFRKVPYRLMMTYSRNYGLYSSAQYTGVCAYGMEWKEIRQNPRHQFSSGFQCEIPVFKGALRLIPGLFWDYGEVLSKNFAATLALKYYFVN